MGLIAYATKRCSMKRKSTTCAMQSSRGYERTRILARYSRSTPAKSNTLAILWLLIIEVGKPPRVP